MKTQGMQISLKAPTAALLAFSAGLLLWTGSAMANPYGTEITIADGVGPNGEGIAKEDNEVELGMDPKQSWDLEGFFLTTDRKFLTIVGGYNFYTGKDGMYAGDIFIDTNGNSLHSPAGMTGIFGSHSDVSNSTFKYDYVLDIDWGNSRFDIVKLNDNSTLTTTYYGDDYNIPSNPWRYSTGGTVKGSSGFSNYLKQSQANTEFSGWGTNNNHYVATFDISSITLGNVNYFHNTMECGNDNLIGYTHAPEPATLLLFGAGLAGMGAFGRKRKSKI